MEHSHRYKEIGRRFLASAEARAIPEERKQVYAKAWGIDRPAIPPVRHLKIRHHTEYTPLKRVYAWIGFLVIVLGVPALLVGIIAAAHFISVDLAASHTV